MSEAKRDFLGITVVALLPLMSILRLLVLRLLPICLPLILDELKLYLLKCDRTVSLLSISRRLGIGTSTEVKVSKCKVKQGIKYFLGAKGSVLSSDYSEILIVIVLIEASLELVQ